MLEAVADHGRDWVVIAAGSVFAVGVVLAGYRLGLAGLRRVLPADGAGRLFLDRSARALGAVAVLLALQLVAQGMPSDPAFVAVYKHGITLLLIVAITWAAVRCSAGVGDVIVKLNPPLAQAERTRQARKIETQTRFITRGLNILIVIVGFAAALMTFPPVQQLGTSLLASAGIGGIILGFAARPVLTNLLAGMQIALTQPFRIDDVLFVHGEWCWVEEVTSTYVVLRVWDLRRLVVPLQWFIENPFQNWTRHSTDLLGTVFLWVDYRMPVDALRTEFLRLLELAPEWDGATSTVQVTDSSSQALQVRFLMSASDSTRTWDLRCRIREGLVAYVQREHPDYLPRIRAELESPETPGDVSSELAWEQPHPR
ncbi:mechanosensitive ion channel family protein [Aquisalimonas asiatica]|uniref:Mechanosensitive ion channel n=1 Tax=Aquisalimonas asiatica TaxID=406100 RepID=A0A1H8UL31_9GAMM|nr:mechanosensitive ion channel domain-containing protein [Aquisalimonas asiatica]SEP03881.1 Mechanosensitive ion channel [Aquisalimonas asiatica]